MSHQLMEQMAINSENKILEDIRSLIEQTRQKVAATVNAGMTLMYWHIGERINREVLGANAQLMANRLLPHYPDNSQRNMEDHNSH